MGAQGSRAVCREGDLEQVVKHLTRKLSPLIAERTPGDLEQAFTEISTTQDPLRLWLLISAYFVYLCTNSIAKPSTISGFIAIAKSHELGKTLLGQLLEANDLTSHVLTYRLFQHGVEEKDLWLLQEIVPRVGNIDAIMRDYYQFSCSALHTALRHGDLETARFLLASGSNPDQCLCSEESQYCLEEGCIHPMDLAARHKELVELVHDLLERNAEFNERCILPPAIRNGAGIDLVEGLIEAGASLGGSIIRDYDAELNKDIVVYDDPVTAAICSGQAEIVALLVYKYQYIPSARDAFERETMKTLDELRTRQGPLCFISPLISAIVSEYASLDVIEDLISAGADVNECTCRYLDVASRAEMCQPRSLGEWSHCEDARVRDLGKTGLSPLQAAAHANNEVLVRRLLSLGAYANPCHGVPALVYAVVAGCLSINQTPLGGRRRSKWLRAWCMPHDALNGCCREG